MNKHKHVIHADELQWTSTGVNNHRLAAERKQLGAASGGKKLGCSMFRVPVGKAAYPFHAHFGNEEAIYILEGEGLARIGEDRVNVAAGDYLALPVGPEAGHQLTNCGSTDLVYLCFSTMIEPEVVLYPDSDKVGAFTGSAPGGDAQERSLIAFYRKGENVPYLDGEE